MRVRLLLAAFLLSVSLQAAPDWRADTYREAVRLYENGMYERASSLLSQIQGEPLADGYSVLCAIKMRSEGFEGRIAEYESTWGGSVLTNLMEYEYGLVLFDRGEYDDAARHFAAVNKKQLDARCLPELAFKEGYSRYAQGEYDKARPYFYEVDRLLRVTRWAT